MPREIRDLLRQLKADPHDAATRREVRERLRDDPDGFARAVRRTIPTTAPPPAPGIQGSRGEVWENHTGNQTCEPLQIFRPRSLKDLRDIIAQAAARKVTARAVATGYSVSDIATTTGYLIETDDLDDRLAIDPDLLKPGVDPDRYIRFEAGVTITQLHKWLEAREQALPNQPGSSKLTFVGGMMTASHGSGIKTGTLASMVRSLVLVARDGKIFRIEPSDGMTDPAKYAARFPSATLKQDDDWFYSALVSFGALGVVYSVTVETVDLFWLTETRTVTTWSDVKALLATPPAAGAAYPPILEEHPHVEFLVNPYPTEGPDDTEHKALSTVRDLSAMPTLPAILRPARNWLTELLASIPISDTLLVGFLNTVPGFAPTALDLAIEGLEDEDVVGIGHEILDLGAPATLDAYAIEVAFPWHEAVEAMQVVIDLARVAADEGDRYHSSPVSLRFVAPERAYLAPQYSPDVEGEEPVASCMIEVPMLIGTEGGFDHLRRLQRALYAVGGRPHWGLELDELTDARGLMAEMYPKWAEFEHVFRQLNSHGVFDNVTTLRLGLTKTGYKRP